MTDDITVSTVVYLCYLRKIVLRIGQRVTVKSHAESIFLYLRGMVYVEAQPLRAYVMHRSDNVIEPLFHRLGNQIIFHSYVNLYLLFILFFQFFKLGYIVAHALGSHRPVVTVRQRRVAREAYLVTPALDRREYHLSRRGSAVAELRVSVIGGVLHQVIFSCFTL